MKSSLLIRAGLIFLFVTSLVSCDENDQLADVKSEVKIEFKTFEKDKNLDITVVAVDDLKDSVYIWTVDGKEQPNSNNSKELYWGPKVGKTEFCLTVINKEHPNGIKICETFTRTQQDVDDVNS